MEPDDPFDLNRFVTAQQSVYARALAEVRSGAKRTHWMWFVFPQLDGLAFSAMAARYAIKSRNEAEAYLRHPILGPRLEECCEAALSVEGRTANQIFGDPDDLKLRSCATLFALAAKNTFGTPPSVFERVLQKYFDGVPDEQTLRLLGEPLPIDF